MGVARAVGLEEERGAAAETGEEERGAEAVCEGGNEAGRHCGEFGGSERTLERLVCGCFDVHSLELEVSSSVT